MKIILPELGEGISNVEIRDVLVKEGDIISKDQPILILETDKASMEIPAEVDGIVSEVHVESGDSISPNDIIITLDSIDKNKISAPDEDTIPKEDLATKNDIEEKKVNEYHTIILWRGITYQYQYYKSKTIMRNEESNNQK